ncbi:putative Peptidylprolyl isomerase [Alteromonas infernus]
MHDIILKPPRQIRSFPWQRHPHFTFWLKTEKEALSILEQLKKGKDFATLAKRHSKCPSGKRGGDLGEFRRGQMVKAFDDVVFKKRCAQSTRAGEDPFRLPPY